MDKSSNTETRETGWRTLYIAGGVAVILVVTVFRRFWMAELTAFNGFGIFEIPDPLPSTAQRKFAPGFGAVAQYFKQLGGNLNNQARISAQLH
jgi:hypothetical protein